MSNGIGARGKKNGRSNVDSDVYATPVTTALIRPVANHSPGIIGVSVYFLVIVHQGRFAETGFVSLARPLTGFVFSLARPLTGFVFSLAQ